MAYARTLFRPAHSQSTGTVFSSWCWLCCDHNSLHRTRNRHDKDTGSELQTLISYIWRWKFFVRNNRIQDVSDENSRFGYEQDRIWGSGIWITDVGRQTGARALVDPR